MGLTIVEVGSCYLHFEIELSSYLGMDWARLVTIERNYFRMDYSGWTKQMGKDLIVDVNQVEHLDQIRMTLVLVRMDSFTNSSVNREN